jgi:hypothetical protein
MGKYGKFWLTVIGVVVSWVTLIAKPPAHVTSHEYIILATGVAQALTVYLIPLWAFKYAKSVGALVTGVLGWAVLVVDSAPGAITATEWAALLTAVAIALGVYGVSNAPASVTARSRVVG